MEIDYPDLCLLEKIEVELMYSDSCVPQSNSVSFFVVHLLSHVRFLATPWTAAC